MTPGSAEQVSGTTQRLAFSFFFCSCGGAGQVRAWRNIIRLAMIRPVQLIGG